MFNLRGAAIAALLIILPVAGANAQSWTDWAEMARTDSHLSVSSPPGIVSTDQIEFLASHMPGRGHKRELWTWETGMMHMYILNNAQMQKSRRNDLMDTVSQWSDLEALEFDPSTKIERAANKLGLFYYAAMPALNADMHCFVFLQNLRINVPIGYQADPEAAGGIITGFDCQNDESVPLEQHADVMKSYIKGLRRQ